ncbi:Starch-binding associating with outer membrane [Pedobacter steynii]|uniref:Starch-binding associating with outer membrane n=1 Tax=Pedobacter steynii TaxID=430522 RepID=A0A1G9NRU9_9SPHI|nr:RagB/SusD family nutrient uptake outer membrane protein [Pedobacter steynii]NQX39210.1 RagB/SusD family nutrient uptake outer membrane protein [Pedobacter steynii]SDL89109.1 Starch-binding associating with outer membrane [Pedobacter steynii]
MKKLNILILIIVLSTLNSCKKYLDVVPDNIATIGSAFSMRSQAEKFLFTCYSYLPREGSPSENPAMLAGDEYWFFDNIKNIDPTAWRIAKGEQGITSPYLNFWDGENLGQPLFRGIRDCNIFLENINSVLDMSDFEKKKWSAEVKFLKAYYHFYLMRMYGPIPIIDKNMPVSASPEEVKVFRQPIDKCADYLAGLLDEAATDLPSILDKPTTDLGRITKPIALAIKARMLVLVASPLFNGNPDFSSLQSPDGTVLFNPAPDQKKWERALLACNEAISVAESAGIKLYEFIPNATTGALSPETLRTLSIQNAVTERWNTEQIWGASNSRTYDLQRKAQARLDPSKFLNETVQSILAPPIKIAELFYTRNGVPITEDKTWNYANRLNLRTGTTNEKFYIKPGYKTVELHFDRESRFYADLGFDGGIWYGLGKFKDGSDVWPIEARAGGTASRKGAQLYSVTGYWPKKLVSYLNVINDDSDYRVLDYPWPIVRLADLYLMHAEAANEVKGPGQEAYQYLDKVRNRAGLKGVVESWTAFSTNPSKPGSKDGLREIIHQERLIEMAFEGSRFWDLRRWKEAPAVLNGPVKGWDLEQATPEGYYRQKTLYVQAFALKDYFWPIKESNITVNRNLAQNIGW